VVCVCGVRDMCGVVCVRARARATLVTQEQEPHDICAPHAGESAYRLVNGSCLNVNYTP
jgi:hypothetical protein